MKPIILIFITNVLCWAGGYSLEHIYTGDKEGYLNPKWSLDSHLFSIQTINSKEQKAATLWVYQISTQGARSAPVFSSRRDRKSGPQRRMVNAPFEISLGWLIGREPNLLIAAQNYTKELPNKQVFYSYAFNINKDIYNLYPDPFITSRNESGPINMAIDSYGYIYFSLISNNQKLKKVTGDDPESFLTLGDDFPYPIISISLSELSQKLMVICGKETRYKFFLTNGFNEYRKEINLPLDQFTIITESSFSPIHENLIAVIGSDYVLRDDEKAILNICNIRTQEIEKQIPVFKHNQPSPLTRVSYHQWHPLRDQIFYIRENEKDEKGLYYFDFNDGSEHKVKSDEKNVKSFNISPDGKEIVIISNEIKSNMRVYHLLDD